MRGTPGVTPSCRTHRRLPVPDASRLLRPAPFGCLALLLLALLGCTHPQREFFEERELARVLDGYRAQQAQLLEQERQRQDQGILRLEVADDRRVSLHLERASLAVVVRRLLDRDQTPYVLAHDALLRGRVTARFENLPFRQALNVLLGIQGLRATEQDGLLTIHEAEPAPDAKPGPDARQPSDSSADAARTPAASASLPLRHVPADGAAKYLRDLYSGVPAEWAVSVADQPAGNSVAVLGQPAAVRRAAGLLRQADREPAHVFIEALVVEVDSESLVELGTQLQNVASGTLRDLRAAFGVLGANQLVFSYLQDASFKTTFTALVDLLVSTSKARLVSRPYVSTVSNREAKINIAVERHVVTQQVEGGAAVTTTEPVEAGISLTMLPKVFEDENIQLQIMVEDSQFVDQVLESVAVIKDKNVASTVVQVSSGQSVVIGGLVLDRRSDANAGFPWLRKIPLLNLVFAQQASTADKQEVVVIVTPYLWRPGIGVPFPASDAFRIPELRDPARPSHPWWAP
jgi:type II secretory pathway component GspD/PulD (secretin)